MRAEKEFDAMHGLREDKKGNFREKRNDDRGEEEEESSPEKKDKYRGRKHENKSKALTEKDFPELP